MKLNICSTISGDNNLYTVGFFEISSDETDMQTVSPEEPLALWLVTNIPGLDIGRGDVVLSFTGTHRSAPYVFFMYRQTTGRIDVSGGQYDMGTADCLNKLL